MKLMICTVDADCSLGSSDYVICDFLVRGRSMKADFIEQHLLMTSDEIRHRHEKVSAYVFCSLTKDTHRFDDVPCSFA